MTPNMYDSIANMITQRTFPTLPLPSIPPIPIPAMAAAKLLQAAVKYVDLELAAKQANIAKTQAESEALLHKQTGGFTKEECSFF